MISRSPRELYFDSPAGRLCYFEWGEPLVDKPSLLFLHATGFHARIWDSVIRRLPADSHIIAPDMRGHGRSFHPDSLARWDRFAEDIVAFVEWLDLPALYGIGHSMGGFCVAYVAAQCPTRFAGALLVDPVILEPKGYALTQQSELSADDIEPQSHPIARRRNGWESAEAMVEYFSDRAPYVHWHREALEDYCRYGLVEVTSADSSRRESAMQLACPPLLEASVYMGVLLYNPHALLGKVACPVRVLRGRSGERSGAVDFRSSPTWNDLAMQFANGSDSQWSDVSHFVPMEAPQRLAQFITTELATIAR